MPFPSLDFSTSPTSGASASLKPVSSPVKTTAPVMGPPGPPAGYKAPSGGGSTGGAATATAPANNFDPNAAANAQLAAERSAQDAANARIQGAIHDSYTPIYGELDRQLGELPNQQNALTTQVGSLADQEKGDVQSNSDLQKTHLDQAATDEQSQGKKTLNDLSQNVRNLLQGAQFYLGSLGAGDSSAVTEAAGAIGSQAQKTRGDALGVMNTALTQIQRQKNDVDTIAGQNLKQIDDWKSNQIFSIGQWATQQLNQLNTAKAQAQGAEKTAIAQLIQGTESQYIQRMQQLDSAVFNYQAAVSQWQQQQAQTVADQMKLIQSSGSYTSQSPTKYSIITQKAADGTNHIFAVNPTNPNDAGEILKGQGSTTPAATNPFMNLLGNISNKLLGTGNDTGYTPVGTSSSDGAGLY